MSDMIFNTLNIAFPQEVTTLLGTQSQIAEAVQEFTILGLYQEGRISGGKAAELLGLTRRGFISLLARKGMDHFQLTSDEWADEVAVVKSWCADDA